MKRKNVLFVLLTASAMLVCSCKAIHDPFATSMTGSSDISVGFSISSSDDVQTTPDNNASATESNGRDNNITPDHSLRISDIKNDFFVFTAGKGNGVTVSNNYLYMSSPVSFDAYSMPCYSKEYAGEVYNTAFKINLATAEYAPICLDPVCEHSTKEKRSGTQHSVACPFGGGCEIMNIENGTIYYFSRYPFDHKTEEIGHSIKAYSYDEKTLTQTYLFSVDDGMIGMGGFLGQVHEKLFYYTCTLNDDLSYDRSVCCYDLKSGKSSTILTYDRHYSVKKGLWSDAYIRHDHWLEPLFVDENEQIYFKDIGQFFVWKEDPTTHAWGWKIERPYYEELNFYVYRNGDIAPHKIGETVPAWHYGTTIAYCDGQLYWASADYEKTPYTSTEYDPVIYPMTVYRMDVESGNCEVLVEGTYEGFAIGGGYLYSMGFKMERIASPIIPTMTWIIRGDGIITCTDLQTKEQTSFDVLNGGLSGNCVYGGGMNYQDGKLFLLSDIVEFTSDPSDAMKLNTNMTIMCDLLTGEIRSYDVYATKVL